MAHYQRALGWLLDMEDALPDIFKALGSRGDGQTIEEVYHFIYRYYMTHKAPMLEHRVVAFVSERLPSYAVLRLIEIMEKSGQIEKQLTASGHMGYIPRGKF